MTKTELRPFQVEGVKAMRDFNLIALLADELGLGKTIQALTASWKYLPDDPPGPIVVVAPSYLKVHWQREARKHLGLRVEILSGQRVPPEKYAPYNPNQVYVINYDVLVPPNWRSRHKLPRDSWAKWLLDLRPRMVILDEGQYVKNDRAARSRAARKLAQFAPHRLILTGTPIANKPPDLWHLLHILHPKDYPSKFDFCERYTHARKKWFGWEFKGARNLDHLHEELKSRCMIRRRKIDVLQELPPVIHSVVPIEVDLTEYAKAELDYVAWLEESSPLLAARAAQARELTRLTGLKKLAAELKRDAVISWCEDFLEETGSKILLGGHHYSVTESVCDHFGDRAILVDGRMSYEEKQARFDQFNGSGGDVMVANMQAAGAGWSCKSTSDVGILEFPWIPSTLEQFVGRVHGIERGIPGTTAHVRHFVAVGTIEEDICDLLRVKLGWAAQAIDGDVDPGWADIYDEVKKNIKRRVKR